MRRERAREGEPYASPPHSVNRAKYMPPASRRPLTKASASPLFSASADGKQVSRNSRRGASVGLAFRPHRAQDGARATWFGKERSMRRGRDNVILWVGGLAIVTFAVMIAFGQPI